MVIITIVFRGTYTCEFIVYSQNIKQCINGICKKLKKYILLVIFLLTIFCMSVNRAIFYGTYILQFMEEVPAIRNWIHTLKVVGKEINMLEKNKLKWFFLVTSFCHLRLLFLLIPGAPMFMNHRLLIQLYEINGLNIF